MTDEIVDADAHLVEGFELVGRLFAELPGRFEMRADDEHGVGLWIDGRRYPQIEGPGRGVAAQHSTCAGAGADPTTIEGMIADADREGVAVRVCYPSLGLATPAIADVGLSAAFAQIVNEHATSWCDRSGGRLRAVGVVPLEDVARSIEIARAAVRAGCVAVCVPPALASRNLDHPDLEPFYDAIEALGVGLAVHGAPGLYLPPIGVDRLTSYLQVHCVSFPFDQMLAMTCLVSGGVLERHPRLRVAFLEAGCGWAPYFADRLHEHWEKRGDWMPNGWRRDPDEYFARGQIYVTCEPDETLLPAALARIGEDHVMYASDYPHWDGDFPESVAPIRARTDLDETARAKVLGENARRFYALGR